MRRPWIPILHCIRFACIHFAKADHLAIHWTCPGILPCHISRSFPATVGIEGSEWSDNTVPPSKSDASSIIRECRDSSGPRHWGIRMCSSAGFLDSQLNNQARQLQLTLLSIFSLIQISSTIVQHVLHNEDRNHSLPELDFSGLCPPQHSASLRRHHYHQNDDDLDDY
jgi:hypothetical protein